MSAKCSDAPDNDDDDEDEYDTDEDEDEYDTDEDEDEYDTDEDEDDEEEDGAETALPPDISARTRLCDTLAPDAPTPRTSLKSTSS
ncbi:MAG: hypothetical protein K2X53_03300 [Alphaproteobacteria bacterium]|nr:hypothetical protein [Alphaproteobacteria bacterium]